MKAWLTVTILALGPCAFGQALTSTPISSSGEPPGFVYFDRADRKGLAFEIRFVAESKKVRQSVASYSCGSGTPSGSWLFDRHPLGPHGRWMVTASRDGRLCFRDEPSGGSGTTIEFEDVAFDVEHTLTAVNTNGTLIVSLNGDVRTAETVSDPSYRGGHNGIGIGREVNGYHGPKRNDSFFGTICYVNDNGLEPLSERSGSVTGSAVLGASSLCSDDKTPQSPPPPPAARISTLQSDESVHLLDDDHPSCHLCRETLP